MSVNNAWGISGTLLAASAIILQSGALIYVLRRFKRLQQKIDGILNDYGVLRDELSILRTRFNALESHSKGDNTQHSVRFVSTLNEQPYFQQPISRVDSLTSSSGGEYFEAADEWPSDKTALLPTNGQQNSEKVIDRTGNGMKEIDELHEYGEYKQCYDICKKLYNSEPNNVEMLWRLARACHNLASSLDQKNPHRKELIIEGHKFATQAYKLDEKNFPVLKWAAVLTGELTNFLSNKEKIAEGYKFKEYLDKGLAINPKEYSLLHMRGRFSFSVANLSWLERSFAKTFFGAPPSATIDDALTDFLEVEKLRPAIWLENLLYVSRCYVSKNNKPEAAKYLRVALKIEPADDADKEALDEAKKLLNTVSK